MQYVFCIMYACAHCPAEMREALLPLCSHNARDSAFGRAGAVQGETERQIDSERDALIDRHADPHRDSQAGRTYRAVRKSHTWKKHVVYLRLFDHLFCRYFILFIFFRVKQHNNPHSHGAGGDHACKEFDRKVKSSYPNGGPREQSY